MPYSSFANTMVGYVYKIGGGANAYWDLMTASQAGVDAKVNLPQVLRVTPRRSMRGGSSGRSRPTAEFGLEASKPFRSRSYGMRYDHPFADPRLVPLGGCRCVRPLGMVLAALNGIREGDTAT